MTSAAILLLSGITLTATSGMAGLFFSRRSLLGQYVSTTLLAGGSLVGLVGTCLAFGDGGVAVRSLPSPIEGARFALAADALSLLFLLPIFVVTLLGTIYGLGYWSQAEHPEDGQRLRLFYGLLSASMAVIVLAKSSVTFLFGWESMAVSAFFLVTTEDEQDDVRAAGWLYLAASHTATLSLFAMFGLLFGLTGSYDLSPLGREQISPAMANVIFLLALAGFGIKAGLMPLHFWLPSAHAMAPSHVSAMMSGVLLKMGIYGLIRITSLLPEPPLWWGGTLLVLGTISAVLGIVFAIAQQDLKRLLAYSSVDNIGVIAIGLGLALLGRTLKSDLWVVLGLSGALLHVINHATFKSLLFLSAGSLIHAQGTRDIDSLGGVAKTMPWTSAAFLVGGAAACGLPPLNGFVSEFLIYLGLFHTLGIQKGDVALPAASFVIPAMALMGALAVATFVKLYGMIFLGTRRTPAEHPAHESGYAILIPLAVLAIACLVVGAASVALMPALNDACALWKGSTMLQTSLAEAAPLGQLSLALAVLGVMLVAGTALLVWRINSAPLSWTDTWGCGYMMPTPRLQYTGSSLAQLLVQMFRGYLRPTTRNPQIEAIFPVSASFESSVPEVVLDEAIYPAFQFLSRVLLWARLIQRGHIQIYLLYIFAMLVVLLLCVQ
jgi:hydrogenase-4 component B